MKTFRPLAVILFITILLAASAFAQSSKVALIDTGAFGEKGGITKYATARDTLQKEFAPVNVELQSMGTRYENLRKEIEGLQKQTTTPSATLQAKADEYYKLERDIKFKQEDAKARSQSRYNIVMGPVLTDIGKAIQDYAKQKGYTLVLDAAKMAEAGLILGIGDGSVDVTKDFITFYNTRPAGAGTTTTPPK